METSWRLEATRLSHYIPPGKMASSACVGERAVPQRSHHTPSNPHSSKVPWHYITEEGLVPSSRRQMMVTVLCFFMYNKCFLWSPSKSLIFGHESGWFYAFQTVNKGGLYLGLLECFKKNLLPFIEHILCAEQFLFHLVIFNPQSNQQDRYFPHFKKELMLWNLNPDPTGFKT